MGRLTKYGKTSHENGVCCTHFMGKECQEVGGECSYGCKWEEEAWSKLAHYEDMEEQGKLVERIYGYWSLHIDETFDCEYLTCSICGEDFFDGDNDTIDYVPNYCPNCGAKMVVTEAKLNDLNS